jgi:L-fuconolactonase
MLPMIIDAHHHFWKYSPAEYGWISPQMSVLRRDFLPGDLLAETKSAGVDGVVSVQARQTLEETSWLLDFAEHPASADFIRGVVGWVPLISPTVDADLERFAGRTKLRGVRHVLQDEPAEYMLRDDFNRGIGRLHRLGLRYDILIFERQLSAAIELVDRHPNQVFILDHIAKPRIREAIVLPWRERMLELGRRPNVYCKISGMVTEADHQRWTVEQLEPYMQTALEAFGPRRLMIGSDWPVCLLACDYRRWMAIVGDFAARLSAAERKRLLSETAIEAYGL